MKKQVPESILALLPRLREEAIIGQTILADAWFYACLGKTFENGETDGYRKAFLGVMTEKIANKALEKVPRDEEGLKACRQKFRDGFRKAYLAADFRSLGIGTDYHPDKIICEALDAAEIGHGAAPWKSMSHLYGSGLVATIGIGYQQPQKVIYVAPVADELLLVPREDLRACWDLEGEHEEIRNFQVDYVVSVAIDNAMKQAHETSFKSERHREIVLGLVRDLRNAAADAPRL